MKARFLLCALLIMTVIPKYRLRTLFQYKRDPGAVGREAQ